MRNAILVAPYFLETTLRFIRAAATVEGARLSLITHEPPEKIPADLRERLAVYEQLDDALDPQQLMDGVRRVAGKMGSVDRIIAPLEELQETLAEVREASGISGMDLETARNFRDKARMKDIFHRRGIPCARHHLAGSVEEADSFASKSGFPLVAKPPSGSGARNTFRLEKSEDLRECLAAMPPSTDRPTLLEEFVVGREHSFDSVMIGGKPIWYSASRYLPTPLEVLQTPWIQWVVLLPREVETPEFAGIREEGFRALQALGMRTGLSHMEWFRRPDGSIAISEVAARPPGAQFTTLISFAHDYDLYRGWAELMILDRFDPPERKYSVGAAFLKGQGKGRVAAIRGIEHVSQSVGDLVVEAKLPKRGQIPSDGYEGDGYVIVRHTDTDVVEQALQEIVSTIKVELR